MTCAVADVEGDWHLPKDVLKTMGERRHVRSHSEKSIDANNERLANELGRRHYDERDERSMQIARNWEQLLFQLQSLVLTCVLLQKGATCYESSASCSCLVDSVIV